MVSGAVISHWLKRVDARPAEVVPEKVPAGVQRVAGPREPRPSVWADRALKELLRR